MIQIRFRKIAIATTTLLFSFSLWAADFDLNGLTGTYRIVSESSSSACFITQLKGKLQPSENIIVKILVKPTGNNDPWPGMSVHLDSFDISENSYGSLSAAFNDLNGKAHEGHYLWSFFSTKSWFSGNVLKARTHQISFNVILPIPARSTSTLTIKNPDELIYKGHNTGGKRVKCTLKRIEDPRSVNSAL